MTPDQYTALFDAMAPVPRTVGSMQLHGAEAAAALTAWAESRGVELIRYELHSTADGQWSCVRTPEDTITVHLDDLAVGVH